MRHLPPLNSLRAFEAAARHMSFRKAAEELGVTPTAISHQIKLLETICADRLFQRRPRPMRLTMAGQRLLPILTQSFDAIAEVLKDRFESAVRSPLVVTTTTAFAARWLQPRLVDWYAKYPGLPLDVRASEAVMDLEYGEVDLAVRYSRTAPTGGVSTLLYQNRLQPVLSPSLTNCVKPISNPAALLDLPLIHYDWKNGDPDAPHWRDWFAATGRTNAVAEFERCNLIHVGDEIQAIELALAGRGVALVEQAFVERELADGRLSAPFDTTIAGHSFWMHHLPDDQTALTIETFTRWAISHLYDRMTHRPIDHECMAPKA